MGVGHRSVVGSLSLSLSGAHLIRVHTAGTVGLQLASYSTKEWSTKVRSRLCRSSASSVRADEKGMRGRLSVTSTAGRLANNGALLLCVHCAARV